MMKRVFFIGIMLAIGSTLIFSGTARSAGPEPIKIGYLAPYVGWAAKIGTDMRNGFKLHLEEVGYKAAGRQIVFLDEDTEGKPEVGLAKTRKLVEKDRVDILAGIINSPVAYAVRDYVINRKIPLVITNAGATKLTQEQWDPYIFRTSMANGQEELVAAWYAYTKMDAKRLVMMAPDYSGGHEKAESFKRIYSSLGGEIVEEIYPPLGTTDFGPYLAKLNKHIGKISCIWAFFSSSDAIGFINQYNELGLKERIKLWVDGGTVDEAILPSMKEAALGIDNYCHYAPTIDTAENKRFVQVYQKKYGELPAQLADQGYVGSEVIVKALEAVNGKIEDQQAFLKALKNVRFEAPRGAFRFDDHQNAIFNVYVRRVVKENGTYINRIIDTIRDVGQYWTPPQSSTPGSSKKGG